MAVGALQSLGLRERAKTGSLFGRFLIFLIPIFVVASMLGLGLVSDVFLRAERDSINKRIGTFTTRIASVLKEEAQQGNGDLSANLVNLLLFDPAIHCVELIGRSGHILADAPRETGCENAGNRKTVVVPFSDSRGSQLHVQYDEAEIATSEKSKGQFSALAMLIGLFVAMGASWFSFRSIVERPMKVLLEAIRSAGVNGDVAIIKHQTADEMGEVIGAFNEMQVKLGDEARRNREALEHVDRLYNETPALMFSIDANGLMLNVSGHWLEQTGYAREDVVGKAFSGFLRSSPGGHDSGFPLAELTARHELRDIPLQLLRRNGTGMDVLLSAVADKIENGLDAGFLCVLNDVSSLKESQKKLRTQVVTDLLTGLPNRQGLFEYLSAMKPASEKFMERVAILYIDLDNFKWVNETHGHEVGDSLLIEVGRRLRNCLTAADFLARLGGDEFAVVLRGLKQDDDAVAIGHRELGALVAPFHLGEIAVHVGCSIGIALLGTHSSSAEELLRLADLAMHKSKQQGKNRISVYSSDLGDKALTRARVTDQIREALRSN